MTTALVAVETVLLVLLVVLVAGLLRSHAEILRRLGPAEPSADAAPIRADPGAVANRSRRRRWRARRPSGDVVALVVRGRGLGADPAGVPDQRLQHLRGVLGEPRRAAAAGGASRP